MSAERPISKEDVVVLLASALGQHKSDEVITTTASGLGITRPGYTADDVRAIFDKLEKAEGLVGVVARFAVSRGDVAKLIAKAPVCEPAPVSSRDFERESSPGAARVDIMHLISPALGVEKARDAIAQAAARRGVDLVGGLTQSGALAVLDEMTNVEGIVGVVARFAKARFLLNPEG